MKVQKMWSAFLVALTVVFTTSLATAQEYEKWVKTQWPLVVYVDDTSTATLTAKNGAVFFGAPHYCVEDSDTVTPLSFTQVNDTTIVFYVTAPDSLIGCEELVSVCGWVDVRRSSGTVSNEFFSFVGEVRKKFPRIPVANFYMESDSGFMPFASLVRGYQYNIKVVLADSVPVCWLMADVNDAPNTPGGRDRRRVAVNNNCFELKFPILAGDSSNVILEIESKEGKIMIDLPVPTILGASVSTEIHVPVRYTNGQDSIWFEWEDSNRFNKNQESVRVCASIVDLDGKIVWEDKNLLPYWKSLTHASHWIGADWARFPTGPKVAKITVYGVNGTVDSAAVQFFVQNPWHHDFAVAGKAIGRAVTAPSKAFADPWEDYDKYNLPMRFGIGMVTPSFTPRDIESLNLSLGNELPGLPYWTGYETWSVHARFALHEREHLLRELRFHYQFPDRDNYDDAIFGQEVHGEIRPNPMSRGLIGYKGILTDENSAASAYAVIDLAWEAGLKRQLEEAKGFGLKSQSVLHFLTTEVGIQFRGEWGFFSGGFRVWRDDLKNTNGYAQTARVFMFPTRLAFKWLGARHEVRWVPALNTGSIHEDTGVDTAEPFRLFSYGASLFGEHAQVGIEHRNGEMKLTTMVRF